MTHVVVLVLKGKVEGSLGILSELSRTFEAKIRLQFEHNSTRTEFL